jgi:(2R)-ethylmalonyl-CoA mutase
MPKWNPVNLCSYHLQEAGADAVEEAAFALAAAIAVLDACRTRGAIPRGISQGRGPHQLLRQFRRQVHHRDLQAARDGAHLGRDRASIAMASTIPSCGLFRYGVQVNSLGLTEQQPENNVYRILFGMLGVTLSKSARARAVQLPAWNEALGLPRPWDQQWSLRLQQIGAYRDRHARIRRHLRRLACDRGKSRAAGRRRFREEIARIEKPGRCGLAGGAGIHEGAAGALQRGACRSHRDGEEIRVGVNAYTETEPSPLTAGNGNFIVVDEQPNASRSRG